MLRAVGMGDDDFVKPQVGVASSGTRSPRATSLDRLARRSKEGVLAAGGYPLEFGTISVSDGISMGHEGMHFSLVRREVIADSVETVMSAERLDGVGAARRVRQVAAGDADGRGPARPRLGLPVRRHDHARAGRRPGRHDHRRLRGGRRLPRGQDHPRAGRRDRAGDLPGRGRLRRHVHREHDGRRRRGAGHVAARDRRRRPPSTGGATGSPIAPARPWWRCCARASPPGRS